MKISKGFVCQKEELRGSLAARSSKHETNATEERLDSHVLRKHTKHTTKLCTNYLPQPVKKAMFQIRTYIRTCHSKGNNRFSISSTTQVSVPEEPHLEKSTNSSHTLLMLHERIVRHESIRVYRVLLLVS